MVHYSNREEHSSECLLEVTWTFGETMLSVPEMWFPGALKLGGSVDPVEDRGKQRG